MPPRWGTGGILIGGVVGFHQINNLWRGLWGLALCVWGSLAGRVYRPPLCFPPLVACSASARPAWASGLVGVAVPALFPLGGRAAPMR